MAVVRLKAYAKINLGLDVIRKREDNYHEVRMVMQTIDLFDKLVMKEIRGSNIIIKTNLPYLPTNENNLVYKAVKLIKDKFQIKAGVLVHLEKHIPVAAGMAGGSADCAAALIGMNRLFGLGLSESRLMDIGVSLGADVPYCILGGTALAEGIGEVLTPLSPMPECHVLIAKPSMHVSTKFVYEHLNIEALKSHPDIDGIIHSITNNNLPGVASRLENVLETVTIDSYPVLGRIKNTMMEKGSLGALMSGSGPTVFGLFDNPSLAKEAGRTLRHLDHKTRVHVVHIKNRRSPKESGGIYM